MKIIYSEDHRLHFPKGELHGGELVTPFESPARVDFVLERLKHVGLTDITAPDSIDFAPVRKVHDAGYLSFLETAWSEWLAEGFTGEIIPTAFPMRRMQQRVPDNIDGKAGYYASAIETTITASTWGATQASCAVAQTAQRLVAGGERAAFALCRPPGHHAAIDMYGGYCFLNNAAIATQMFRDQGAEKVAILDVDFHHGNGTQDIFYRRGDVLFCSLHGRPEDAFPYFLGYADETGEGEGEGANVNYPMPPGTAYPAWAEALDDACARIRAFGADALVVSLGVDSYKDDPISFFKLESDDFRDYGSRIARLGLPTLFTMEGGYAVEAIGINTVNVLQGFLDA
jgi:acetoin utilization deacetylase AcuC-like enzyme